MLVQAVDNLTGGYTEPQGLLERGMNTAGQFLGGSAGMSAGVFPAIGAGLATETAKDMGVGAGGQLAAGILGGMGPSAVKSTVSQLKNAHPVLRAAGLGPKNFDKKGYDTFQQLGAEPLAKYVTDNTGLSVMEDFIKRTPFFGR